MWLFCYYEKDPEEACSVSLEGLGRHSGFGKIWTGAGGKSPAGDSKHEWTKIDTCFSAEPLHPTLSLHVWTDTLQTAAPKDSQPDPARYVGKGETLSVCSTIWQLTVCVVVECMIFSLQYVFSLSGEDKGACSNPTRNVSRQTTRMFWEYSILNVWHRIAAAWDYIWCKSYCREL